MIKLEKALIKFFLQINIHQFFENFLAVTSFNSSRNFLESLVINLTLRMEFFPPKAAPSNPIGPSKTVPIAAFLIR